MVVKITSEEELIKYARELTHLVANVRYAQKLWEDIHGSKLLDKKKSWEGKLDEFLKAHSVEKVERLCHVEIKIENNE
jgi:hypothetical protein